MWLRLAPLGSIGLSFDSSSLGSDLLLRRLLLLSLLLGLRLALLLGLGLALFLLDLPA